MFEIVDGGKMTDGRRIDWYTISSPELTIKVVNIIVSSLSYMFHI